MMKNTYPSLAAFGFVAFGLIASYSTHAIAQTAPATEDTALLAQPEIINPADIIEWKICNETSFILRIANATLRDGEIKARGWQTFQPAECISENIARGAPRFLYAESSNIHRGGIREWKGDISLCAKDTDFESAATDNCRVKNFETRNYFAVKPDENTTTLIEPSDFGDKALVAGTQRLLRDAGYKVTAIDGLPGRRTTRSLREFQKAEEIETLPEGQELLKALTKAAERAIENIGLRICNESDTRIFSAVGMQEDGNWSSRGWWAVEPNSCTRPITRSLIGLDTHYYALKEPKAEENVTTPINGDDLAAVQADLRLRSVATIPAQFCIAESQFSALGREMCLEGGYGVANFRPLPNDKDGVTITLTNTDFAEPGPEGLRR